MPSLSYLPSYLKPIEPALNEHLTCNKYEEMLNDLMHETLDSVGFSLSKMELQLREEVLASFTAIVLSWATAALTLRGHGDLLTEEVKRNPEHIAQVQPYGSYRQGVHMPGADIDTVVLVPEYIQRHADFFGDEPHCLQQILLQRRDCEMVNAIKEARIPVIKIQARHVVATKHASHNGLRSTSWQHIAADFGATRHHIEMRGVQLDILLCRVTYLPDGLLPAEAQLESMMRTSDYRIFGLTGKTRMASEDAYSLDGYRVALLLRDLIHPDQYPHFQVAMKFAKAWAEQRGIYSNAIGYLGGVNFALLCAKVAMWLPRVNAAVLVLSMFVIFSQWNWAEPVMLLEPEQDFLDYESWYYQTVANASQLLDRATEPPFSQVRGMGIITPGYPAQNSTYNVDPSTLKVIQAEFARGAQLAAKMQAAEMPPPAAPGGEGAGDDGGEWGQVAWVDFLEPSTFYTEFQNYLEVVVGSSTSEEMQILKGVVNSRLRHLVSEAPSSQMEARAWPKPIKLPPEGKHHHRVVFVIGLRLSGQNKQFDLRDWKRRMHDWIHQKGWSTNMDVQLHVVPRKSLSSHVAHEAQEQAAFQDKLAVIRQRHHAMLRAFHNPEAVPHIPPLPMPPGQHGGAKEGEGQHAEGMEWEGEQNQQQLGGGVVNDDDIYGDLDGAAEDDNLPVEKNNQESGKEGRLGGYDGVGNEGVGVSMDDGAGGKVAVADTGVKQEAHDVDVGMDGGELPATGEDMAVEREVAQEGRVDMSSDSGDGSSGDNQVEDEGFGWDIEDGEL